MTRFRTALILGRISNLPTVWSNILCAWIIVGGYDLLQLLSYLLGSSALYVGGMYLNDYSDREFDRQYRQERPIPSGQIGERTVLISALSLLAIGLLGFAWTGLLPTAFGLGIVAAVVIYDLAHKGNPTAPLFMALCRALLYLVVVSAFENSFDKNILIAAGTAYLFVLGITFLARGEATTNEIDYPALAMIALPAVASFYYRPAFFDAQRIAVLSLFVAWNALAFLRARANGQLIVGKTIGPLLASIPLLDLLILATLGLATQGHLFLFAALFALAYAAQRLIPAS